MKVEKKPVPKIPVLEQESSSAVGEVIRCSKLNIRSRPDPKSEIIDVLPAGTRVSINLSAKFDKYYEILSPSGKKGYAMKTYISLIE